MGGFDSGVSGDGAGLSGDEPPAGRAGLRDPRLASADGERVRFLPRCAAHDAARDGRPSWAPLRCAVAPVERAFDRDEALMPSPRTRSRDVESVSSDMQVGFVLSPCFTLLPFAGFVDTLRLSADEGDRSRQICCQWRVLGPSLVPIRSSCGVEVLPRQIYGDPADFDYIVVAGGLLGAFEQHAPETFNFLRAAMRRGVPVVGLCTGSFAMAEAGLLDGRLCAIHFRHRAEFMKRYPAATVAKRATHVFDGNMITCAGGANALHVAAAIVTRHSGKARAPNSLAYMLFDEDRGPRRDWRIPYESLMSCGDWRVQRTISLMLSGLSEPYSIRQLAHHLGTSVSGLDRAFTRHAKMTPSRLWRQMRLQYARWWLLSTDSTITAIAHECGFYDCAHLVHSFREEFGQTPQRFRTAQMVSPKRAAKATGPQGDLPTVFSASGSPDAAPERLESDDGQNPNAMSPQMRTGFGEDATSVSMARR